jgi:uncharacterized membrane protein
LPDKTKEKIMQVRDVSAAHGWYWVRDAFKLFGKNPAIWIALTVVLIIIWFVMGKIPYLGPILLSLIYPALLAGLMAGARKVDSDGELELADLFSGFRINTAQLITIGGIGLALQFILFGGLMLAGIKEPPMPASGQVPDVAAMQTYLAESALPILIGLALWVPITAALWFTSALLMFNKMSAVDAIKWSFYACIANIIPFLIYGLVMFGLMLLVPFTLFLGMIVLVPVMIITYYTAYKDIFDEADAPQAINPPENV